MLIVDSHGRPSCTEREERPPGVILRHRDDGHLGSRDRRLRLLGGRAVEHRHRAAIGREHFCALRRELLGSLLAEALNKRPPISISRWSLRATSRRSSARAICPK
ncbi:MAG: hypothetical protein ACREM3_15075 [Candidatus Rokuibacteriota bacterium]